MQERIEFVLGRSRFLLVLLSTIYGGSIVLTLTLQIHFTLKLSSITLFFFLLKRDLRLHYTRTGVRAVTLLWREANGEWGIQTQSGHSYKVSLLRDSYRTSLLFVLRFQSRDSVYTVVIPLDSVQKSEYKTLYRSLDF